MTAINLNRRDYYVTGITIWDDGREHAFDEFKPDPILCPLSMRYGPEIERDDPEHRRFRLPSTCVGYTITYLTCEKLNAAQHEIEDARTESHCARMLDEMDADQ